MYTVIFDFGLERLRIQWIPDVGGRGDGLDGNFMSIMWYFGGGADVGGEIIIDRMKYYGLKPNKNGFL